MKTFKKLALGAALALPAISQAAVDTGPIDDMIPDVALVAAAGTALLAVIIAMQLGWRLIKKAKAAV